jgi:hypothetical protein
LFSVPFYYFFFARAHLKPRRCDVDASFVCLCFIPKWSSDFFPGKFKSQFLLNEKQRNTTTAVRFPLCACFFALAFSPNSILELSFFYTAGCLFSTRCLLLCEELEHEASQLTELM